MYCGRVGEFEHFFCTPECAAGYERDTVPVKSGKNVRLSARADMRAQEAYMKRPRLKER